MVLKYDRWKGVSWEEMARENPLYAVQSTGDMQGAAAAEFSPEQLETLFAKGRKILRNNLRDQLLHSPDPPEETFVVEYGCGVGRILKALCEEGYRCAGVDISPTMLDHCRRLVPELDGLYGLDDAGRTTLPDGTASVVFSYAVVQHIASLKTYLGAFDEMCRILKPGGRLTVQVNCKDFEAGFDNPGRTENFEDHSLHYRPGETTPFLRHEQNHWSGVYIGQDLLTRFLKERGVKVKFRYHHIASKPMMVWFNARKVD